MGTGLTSGGGPGISAPQRLFLTWSGGLPESSPLPDDPLCPCFRYCANCSAKPPASGEKMPPPPPPNSFSCPASTSPGFQTGTLPVPWSRRIWPKGVFETSTGTVAGPPTCFMSSSNPCTSAGPLLPGLPLLGSSGLGLPPVTVQSSPSQVLQTAYLPV